MLALADFANDERLCWPAISTVAKKTRISHRQAQRTVRRMVKQGHLVAYEGEGRHGTNLYEIPAPRVLQTLPDLRPDAEEDDADDTHVMGDTPDTGDVGGDDTDDVGGVTPVTPNPSGTVTRTINGAPAHALSLFLADSLSSDPTVSVNEYRQVEEKSQQVKAKKEAYAVKVEGGSAAKAAHGAFYTALRTVCRSDDSIALIRGRLNRAAKELRMSGNYTPEQVTQYFGPGSWWYRADFRGKAGKNPTPEWVLAAIGDAANTSRSATTDIGGGAVSMPG
jgi:hypothetical protein